MIRRTVSAAFLLRDGFTGRTLTSGAGTRCLLDGRPLPRPVWKRDGYLILTDLAPGEHELRLTRAGYREEVVNLTLGDGGHIEDTISLKPGPGYRFPSETVRVSIRLKKGRVPAENVKIWFGIQLRTRLVLAQEKAESGESTARLFCEGSAALLPIPGHFLFNDPKTPELVYLRSLRDESGEFALPFTAAHPRGTELIPMQSYSADETGTVQLLLAEPGALLGFDGRKVYSAKLSAGAQTLEWNLEG